MKLTLLAILLGALSLLDLPAEAATPADGANRPQWRRPQRDGQITGLAWPEKLDTNLLQPIWRGELGPSYSGQSFLLARRG